MSLPGRFVDTSSGRVFVHRAGPEVGEPLVLIHGFFVSHFYFRHVVPRLAERRAVVAIDLPGFGESDRPSPAEFAYDAPAFARIVEETLAALAIERADVLGHSMGGGVALALAADRPRLVNRLILVDAAVYPLPLPVEIKLALQPTIGPLLWRHVFRKADMRRMNERYMVRDPRATDDEFIDYYWARFNRAGGIEASWASLRALAQLSDATTDPGRVTAPTQIIWGDEDRCIPPAHGKRLQRAISGARLSIVPACGHMPHLERPEEFLRQLVPFLDAPTQRAPSVAPVPRGRGRA